MMKFVGRTDKMFIQAIKTGAWRTYVLLWFGTTLAVAAASFLLIFVPAVSWEALAPYYVSMSKGTPVVSMTWAHFMSALQISELEGFIAGLMTFCAAPLLMAVQYRLGDFEERAIVEPVTV